jgi:hypothetical protein
MTVSVDRLVSLPSIYSRRVILGQEMCFSADRPVTLPYNCTYRISTLFCRVIDESCEPQHQDEVFEALVSCDVPDLRFEVQNHS